MATKLSVQRVSHGMELVISDLMAEENETNLERILLLQGTNGLLICVKKIAIVMDEPMDKNWGTHIARGRRERHRKFKMALLIQEL